MTCRHRKNETGSALIYILIAIALLALLTITFMQPSSQQTQSQNTFKLVSDLQSQIDFIRSSVQECVVMHYKGDPRRPPPCGQAYASGVPTCAGEEDEGADHRYPIKPNSLYFDNNTVDPDNISDREVGHLRCPGNPGNDPDHTPVFSASSGKFLPQPPDLFEQWQWYNGVDGVFFWIETDKTDAFIQTALQKLDDKYSACEAEVVDATAAAVDLDTVVGTGDGVLCNSGSTCFRMWMIRKTAC